MPLLLSQPTVSVCLSSAAAAEEDQGKSAVLPC